MTIFQAFILGILQGICEFFPVSSSAHLKIFEMLFGLLEKEEMLLFDLFCHLGTMIAAIWFLKKEIFALMTTSRNEIKWYAIAIFPLVPFYFFLKPLREWAAAPELLGFFLLVSSFLLFFISFHEIKEKNRSSLIHKIIDVLFIGVMQATALIPGISRSGATISASCLRGWKIKEAIMFSFLLAIPTVLGGTVLESYKAIRQTPSLSVPSFWMLGTGFVTALLVGRMAIGIIFKIQKRQSLRFFAYYLLLFAVLVIGYTKLM